MIGKIKSFSSSDKSTQEKYEKISTNFDRFSWRLWSKYRNHTLSEKFKFHFYLNATFSALLGLVYWRNKCYFKFSRVMYMKYRFSYIILISFFFVSTMCLILSKNDAKEQLRRYKFIYSRYFKGEWQYIKESKN